MIEDKKWPVEYGNAIEKFLTCQVLYMLQIAHMVPDVIGKMTSIHKFQMYMHSILKGQIRICQISLHKLPLQNLKDLLDSRGILSTGHCHLSVSSKELTDVQYMLLLWSTSHTQILLYR